MEDSQNLVKDSACTQVAVVIKAAANPPPLYLGDLQTVAGLGVGGA